MSGRRDGDHFSDRAPLYARARPTYPRALGDWLGHIVPGRACAWEAGCGSGQLTTQLAERFDVVIATDASVRQLAHAPALARVRWAAATAEQAPVRDASCDLVVAAQAAHWFDLSRFFAEASRTARDGGVVALVGYGNATLDDAPLQERFVRFYHDEIGSHWPAQRHMLLDGYASVDFPFDEIEAPALTLTREWTADEMLAYVDTWSAVRAARAAGAHAAIADFARDLRRLWGDRARRVTWPMPIRAGRVRGSGPVR